jgi:hypothetical protein
MSDIVAFLYSNAWRIAGVAAVVLLALGAALIGDTADFSAELAMTTQGVTNLYHAQPTFSSLTTSVAYNYAPSSMRGAGNTLVTPWNGQVTFAPDGNPSLYDVNVTNVPASQCANLAGALGGVQSMTVNGQTLANNGSGIDAGSVAGACGNTGNVSLSFTLGK